MSYDCEILAPAGRTGDILPLIAAGADAIYVGLSGFSARPESADLSGSEIMEILPLVHSNGKKLYVAINGNIFDSQLSYLLQKVSELDRSGVDAFIISDYGLIGRLTAVVTHARLHASTLTGVYNFETVRLLKKMGVQRIILSSDLYLDEIADLTERVPEMEYEIVADGGICFNSNRQCLLPHEGEGDAYHVYCQKDYRLMRGAFDAGPARSIGGCPGKLHWTMGIYMGLGIVSFKAEGRTNSLNYICMRVKKMAESKNFYMSHACEIEGMMHYISRMQGKGGG